MSLFPMNKPSPLDQSTPTKSSKRYSIRKWLHSISTKNNAGTNVPSANSLQGSSSLTSGNNSFSASREKLNHIKDQFKSGIDRLRLNSSVATGIDIPLSDVEEKEYSREEVGSNTINSSPQINCQNSHSKKEDELSCYDIYHTYPKDLDLLFEYSMKKIFSETSMEHSPYCDDERIDNEFGELQPFQNLNYDDLNKIERICTTIQPIRFPSLDDTDKSHLNNQNRFLNYENKIAISSSKSTPVCSIHSTEESEENYQHESTNKVKNKCQVDNKTQDISTEEDVSSGNTNADADAESIADYDDEREDEDEEQEEQQEQINDRERKINTEKEGDTSSDNILIYEGVIDDNYYDESSCDYEDSILNTPPIYLTQTSLKESNMINSTGSLSLLGVVETSDFTLENGKETKDEIMSIVDQFLSKDDKSDTDDISPKSDSIKNGVKIHTIDSDFQEFDISYDISNDQESSTNNQKYDLEKNEIEPVSFVVIPNASKRCSYNRRTNCLSIKVAKEQILTNEIPATKTRKKSLSIILKDVEVKDRVNKKSQKDMAQTKEHLAESQIAEFYSKKYVPELLENIKQERIMLRDYNTDKRTQALKFDGKPVSIQYTTVHYNR
ncbi:hypothetical protein Kpol_1061p1 [Vanderwaltozyma polyspora DSM 70294]|uniref:Uncharacterized protein n=1 Tax=Vanderwaltozyma polyspora (strain ATCC 22028 / DSM 70294 / BCRC 21397 / CBS 2163 / NBRC 10782 / NRRL Y-8283 / UCD 57-17) TaxID=436907 RepID=A7TJC9_VANPO|nr:uncharacterized protein Kpol_1061p1 [Vanderwaltozyma polyspora DSM 70294]EDO17579.1 hypothetical protein Kpol_1061p1 [Vanderwaltozyma polyspora DSM 70294]